MFFSDSKFKYDFIYKPALTLSPEDQEKFVSELRGVAAKCFDETPNYQVLTGEDEELSRAVIMTARNEHGELLGFCSSLMLPVEHVGEVLHLGLTCVVPSARRKGLTHKLLSKLIVNLLFRHSPIHGIWFTNVASVISSLGNVALHFEDVYPSPFFRKNPSFDHLRIAEAIADKYREPIAIGPEAFFCKESFVFKESVKGSVFHKYSDDKRYHHRKNYLTKFYLEQMDIDNGDELLQVGRVSLLSYPKYLIKKMKKSKNIEIIADLPASTN